MTSTVTKATGLFLQSQTYHVASTAVGIITILFLIFLLIEKELLRAHGGLRASQGVIILNMMIVPLLLTLVVVVVQRLMGMLPGAH
ncbi:MAG TPA: hypothetical protein VHB98_12450 [Chloroflexota bacterium]|nr:hypothetical protein [Chloroflexota bacterium]